MKERLLLSRNGKLCWKAIVRGRSYTIYSGSASSPKLRGSNTVKTAIEAQERVQSLEAHMRTKGYRDPDAAPVHATDKLAPDAPPPFASRIRMAAAKPYVGPLRRAFKPSRESSLEALASLAVVLLAHRRLDNLLEVADFAKDLGPAVTPSHQHYIHDVLALASQGCRELGDSAATRRWRRFLKKIPLNPHVLTRDWVERHHDFGLHKRGPMTVGQETKWRITMVRVLAKVAELGGSPSLPKAHAQDELDEHVAHLRAIWKVQQDAAPQRPRGRKAPHPIASHLFPADAAG